MADEPRPVEGQPLQFENAEPLAGGAGAGNAASSLACHRCQRALADEYYEIGGQTVCSACRDRMAAELAVPVAADRFILAVVYGGAAALAGALLWWGVRALTGYELGLIAVVVGLMVGLGVKKGSGGRGGRRFQVLAVLLTYSGVTLNYVPDVVKGLVQQANQTQSGTATPDGGVASAAADGGVAVAAATPEATSTPTPVAPSGEAAAPSKQSVGVLQIFLLVAMVFGIAFAAPFLAGFENILGILIIGFALWEAWKINRAARLVFTGPYRVTPSAPPGGGATGETFPAGPFLTP